MGRCEACFSGQPQRARWVPCGRRWAPPSLPCVLHDLTGGLQSARFLRSCSRMTSRGVGAGSTCGRRRAGCAGQGSLFECLVGCT
jgi:hypothetical protein